MARQKCDLCGKQSKELPRQAPRQRAKERLYEMEAYLRKLGLKGRVVHLSCLSIAKAKLERDAERRGLSVEAL
mgnify:CR=1 FL=1